MKEKEKRRRRSLPKSRKGFASVYFLALMLYCISVIMVVLANDMDRMRAILNLEKHEALLEEEGIMLAYVKNALKTGELEEGTYTAGNASYMFTMREGTVWLDLYGEGEESMELQIDEETNEIAGWEITGCSLEAEEVNGAVTSKPRIK
jgi:hypothetical protein